MWVKGCPSASISLSGERGLMRRNKRRRDCKWMNRRRGRKRRGKWRKGRRAGRRGEGVGAIRRCRNKKQGKETRGTGEMEEGRQGIIWYVLNLFILNKVENIINMEK